MARSWRDVVTAPIQVGYTRGGLGQVRTTHRARSRRGGGSSGSGGSGMSPELEQALRKVEGGGGGGGISLGSIFDVGRRGVMGALDVIDTPRAAVVATLAELDRVTAGDGFSTSDIIRDTRDNISSAEAFNTNGMAGLTADILLDPLTYLAPQSKLDDVRSVARSLTTEGVEKLGKQGAKDAAARVLRARTASVLNDNELAAIGAEGGIYLSTPGKGSVARALQVDHLIDKVAGKTVPRQIQIASRQSAVGKAGRAVSTALHKPVAGVLNSRPVRGAVEKGFSGSKPLLQTMMRSGDPELATQGLWGLQADAQGRYAAHGWEARQVEQAHALLKRAQSQKIDTTKINHALRGDLDALAEVAAKDATIVDDFRALNEGMRMEFNHLADVEGVGAEVVADAGAFYSPRYLDETSPVGAQMLADGARQGAEPQRVVNIMGRNIVPGEEFMGRRIMDPVETGKSVERQVDEILYANGVIDDKQLQSGASALWKDDLAETLPTYIRTMGQQLSREVTAGRLRQLGIGDSVLMRITNADDEAAAGIVHQLTSRLTRAKAKQRRAQLWADEATEGFEQVQKDADDVARSHASNAERRADFAADAWDQVNTPNPDAEALKEYSAAAYATLEDLQEGTQAWLRQADRAHTAMSTEIAAQAAEAAVAKSQLDAGLDRLDALYAHQEALQQKLEGALERADFQMGGGEARIAQLVEETSDELSAADALLDEMEAAWGDSTDEMLKLQDALPQIEQKLKHHKDQLENANAVLAYEHLLRRSGRDDYAWETGDAWSRLTHGKAAQAKRYHERQLSIGQAYLGSARRRLAAAKRSVDRASGELYSATTVQRAAKEANDEAILQMFDWGRDSLARQWQALGGDEGQRQALAEVIMRPALEAEEALEPVQREIARMGPSLADLQGNVRRNERELSRLKSELADFETARDAKEMKHLAEQLELRTEAEDLFEAARQIQAATDHNHLEMWKLAVNNAVTGNMADDAIAQRYSGIVAHLEGQAKAAQAALLDADDEVARFEGYLRAMGDVEIDEKIVPMLHNGYRQFGSNTQLPEAMVKAMSAASRMTTPEGFRSVMRVYDKAVNLLKRYQILSPGFHFRNLYGGINNNWLAGMDEGAYLWYAKASRGDFDSLDPMVREAFESFEGRGFRTGGQTAFEIEQRGFTDKSWNPLSDDFAVTRGSRAGGEHTENFLRGSLYMDEYVKRRKLGLAPERAADEAQAKMLKFHFDYEDLSSLERSAIRRVIPFYTWTRKNLPLQLEMIAKQPQKINRYFVIKRNVEAMSEEEGVVPDYFEDSFAIRLPFGTGGGQIYAMPDVPFMSVAEATDPGMAAGMVTPILKTPYEISAGKQVYKGIPLSDDMKPMPAAMAIVPGLPHALSAMGWAERGADGGWYTHDRALYAVEQALPLMGRARRLLPSEDKYEDRWWTTMLSFNLGLGARTNTRSEQENVLWGRYYDVKEDLEKAQQLGHLDEGRIGADQVIGAVG